MKKIKILLLILGVAAAVAGIAVFALGAIYETTNENTIYYYSKIDNSRVTEITPHGGMNYRYELDAYGESGESRDMTLDTSRVLRDEAYIRIEIAPVRGVIGWAEVLYDELPAAVRTKYGS